MQKEEYLIKNACYSVTKYYLCKQNNKRSLLGRKQRNQVTRSFPNRYLFSCTNKVTSLFSTSCVLDIILWEQTIVWRQQTISCPGVRPSCVHFRKKESGAKAGESATEARKTAADASLFSSRGQLKRSKPGCTSV